MKRLSQVARAYGKLSGQGGRDCVSGPFTADILELKGNKLGPDIEGAIWGSGDPPNRWS